MPSIFIWKSSSENTSKNTIRVYSGLNWCLEDNDINSFSYKIDEQISFNYNNTSVLVRNIITMSSDWTGSTLIQIATLPYLLIKSDSYATLEVIGNWMRCTLNSNKELQYADLNNEYSNIIKWINCGNDTINVTQNVSGAYKGNNNCSFFKK